MVITPITSHFPDLTGCTLQNGRYLLIAVLGAGSYGKCYKAVDTTAKKGTSSYVAIKCLLKPKSGSREETFQNREIALHRRITNAAVSNTVTFHDTFSEGKFSYVVLDLCDDGDLYAAIVDRNLFNLNTERIKSVFVQIIDGLAGCHAQGVYHRDIKPENVLCMKDGRVKLADFGLSTAKEACREFKCGSSFYMSPECLNEEFKWKWYSAQHNDIWSLGVLFVNLLTTRQPWRKALSTDVSFSAFLKDPEFFRNMFDLSHSANDILLSIFKLDPTARVTLADLRTAVLNADTFFTDTPAPKSSWKVFNRSEKKGTPKPTPKSETSSGSSAPDDVLITPPTHAVEDVADVPEMEDGLNVGGRFLPIIKSFRESLYRQSFLRQPVKDTNNLSDKPRGPAGAADALPPRRIKLLRHAARRFSSMVKGSDVVRS